jgi:hypothetical protein
VASDNYSARQKSSIKFEQKITEKKERFYVEYEVWFSLIAACVSV